MLSETMKENCRKVANQERCIHNMVFEYCAVCQKVKTVKEIRFPIEITDDITGKLKTIWLNREVEQVHYQRYR